MTNIGQISANSTAVSSPQSAEAKAELNYDSFLKLLVATMQNQDPTKPNDPAQTLSQLASFSTVEQNIKTNTKLDGLMSIFAAGQASSFIGRRITSADGTVTGLVASVEVGASGLVASLTDGTKVPISAGIEVFRR